MSGNRFASEGQTLSVAIPLASDEVQRPSLSLAKIREVRVSALSDTSETYEGVKSESSPPVASPSNASASGSPQGKRSKALARAMNDDLTEKDPPAQDLHQEFFGCLHGSGGGSSFFTRSVAGATKYQKVVSPISGYQPRVHDHDGAVGWGQGRL